MRCGVGLIRDLQNFGVLVDEVTLEVKTISAR